MHCICILYTCQDLWPKKILDYARNFNLVVCDLGVYRTKQKVIKYHYYNPGNVSSMKKHKSEIISCDLTVETYHVSRPKLSKSKFLEKKSSYIHFKDEWNRETRNIVDFRHKTNETLLTDGTGSSTCKSLYARASLNTTGI